jgi:hypothetical protein
MSSYLLAARNGDWQTMLSYLNIDENVKFSVDETTNKTAAVLAIENNRIDVLRAMLDRGVALYRERSRWYDQLGSAVLLGHLAASLGNIDAIKALVDVNDRILDDSRHDNILVIAAQHNQRDLVEWLIDVANMYPDENLVLDIINRGYISLASWLMSTERADIDELSALILAAHGKHWKFLSGLLEICDLDLSEVNEDGETFWDVIDWRALVTVHANNKDAIGFLETLRENVLVPESVTRLMRNANIFTNESYLSAAKEANWSHMSACLDEYFLLSKSIGSDRKSAAMLIIDSGNRAHLSILTKLNNRGALFHVDEHSEDDHNFSVIHLCIYAAETAKVDSTRILIAIGGDILVQHLAMHFADYDGGLEIMRWLKLNYEDATLHGVSKWGENVLVEAILGDRLEMIEWLMDTCNLKTYTKSPLYIAFTYGSASTARWFLDTGRSSNVDCQTEFIDAIKNTEWRTATGLIEICNVNIDEDFLWCTINWVDVAKNNSEDGRLFLRALLPRVDFPTHIYLVLMNTLSRHEYGTEKTYLHRQLVLDGMRVREKVKLVQEERTRYIGKLDLPDDMIHEMLHSYLGDDEKMDDLTTAKMWRSISLDKEDIFLE